jgi:hypothetical protein
MLVDLEDSTVTELTPLTVSLPEKETFEFSESSDYLATYSCFSILFDMSIILISFADIITDSIVTYYFYMDGKMDFFGISIVILFAAHLVYCFLFVIAFARGDRNVSLMSKFCCACFISPVVSLLVYLTVDPSSKFVQTISKVDFIRLNFKNGLQKVILQLLMN